MANSKLFGLEDLELQQIRYVYTDGITVVYTFFADDFGYWRWARAVDRADVNERGFLAKKAFADKKDCIKDAIENTAMYDFKLG